MAWRMGFLEGVEPHRCLLRFQRTHQCTLVLGSPHTQSPSFHLQCRNSCHPISPLLLCSRHYMGYPQEVDLFHCRPYLQFQNMYQCIFVVLILIHLPRQALPEKTNACFDSFLFCSLEDLQLIE